MTSVLTANNVTGGYAERTIVHGVSLHVGPGERLLMIGPNGCGKTTLFKMLAGVLPTGSGRLTFDGEEMTAVPTHLRMQMGLGYLTQTRNVFPSLTVEENLHLSYWHGNGDYAEQRNRIVEAFCVLQGKMNRRAGLLSGGERQALAVSMAMMRPVKVLLLDEPTAGLSPKAAEGILRTIHEAQEVFGFASVMVEHNLRVVGKWVSRVMVMKQGRLVAEEQDPQRLFDHDWLQRYYFE